MSSNESEAYKIMTSLDVDYVLVIFGGVIGYSGDDINKFLWMVRIAEGEHPKDIRVILRYLDLFRTILVSRFVFNLVVHFDRKVITSLREESLELMQREHQHY